MSESINPQKKHKGGPQEGSGRPAKNGRRLSGKLDEKQDRMLDEIVATGKYKTRVEGIEAGIELLYKTLVKTETD